MSKWISVDERMPDVGEVVLCYFPDREVMQIDTEEWIEYMECPVVFSSSTICVGVGWAESDIEEISHWMPLPEPPGVHFFPFSVTTEPPSRLEIFLARLFGSKTVNKDVGIDGSTTVTSVYWRGKVYVIKIESEKYG